MYICYHASIIIIKFIAKAQQHQHMHIIIPIYSKRLNGFYFTQTNKIFQYLNFFYKMKIYHYLNVSTLYTPMKIYIYLKFEKKTNEAINK
jgi:hypothetical protein